MQPRKWMTSIKQDDAISPEQEERYNQIMLWLTDLIREIDTLTDDQANFVDESYARFADNPGATMSDKQYYWTKGLYERVHSPNTRRRRR